MTTNNFYSS
jgi:hypothetical protein